MDNAEKYVPRAYDLVSYVTLYGKRFGVIEAVKDGVLEIKTGRGETVLILEVDFRRFQMKKVSISDILEEVNKFNRTSIQLKQE